MNKGEYRLKTELAGVQRRLERIEIVAPEVAATGDDNMDAVVQGEEREMLLNERDRLKERERALVFALRRLQDGREATCEDCGEPIAPKRLEAIPEAVTCVGCQAVREALA